MLATQQHDAPLARLVPRLLSLAYEALILSALLLVGGAPFVIATRGMEHLVVRPFFQVYLATLAGAYFVFQWCHGGQTLPMKTWRLRLVSADGGAITARQAIQRYCLALFGTLALGAGFAWALVDRDRQFLHDRLAGTRIVRDEG